MNTEFESMPVEEMQYMVTSLVEQVLDSYNLKKAPAVGTFEACLDAYTKEKLLKLSEENGFEAKRSWKKAEIVQYMMANIMATFEARCLLLGRERLILLRGMAEGAYESEDLMFEEVLFYVTVFEEAVRMGLLYASDQKAEVSITMPIEVKESIDRVLLDYEQVKEAHRAELLLWEQLTNALQAGVHLYGAVSFGNVIDLWEIAYGKKGRAIEETIDFMRESFKWLPLLAIENDLLIVGGNYVGNPEYFASNTLFDFYFYRAEHMQHEYYLPSKKEFNYYAKHSFNRHTPVYKRLKQLLEKNTNEIDLVMEIIEMSILLDGEMSSVFQELVDIGALHLGDRRGIEKFTELYISLHNNSRLWGNAGFTPSELERQRDKQAQVIPFNTVRQYENVAETKQPTKAKKVGRNAPCPCGSGKKYKKCCWNKK